MMATREEKGAALRLVQLVTDLRVILTACGLVMGGAGVKVFGDAGVTEARSRAIADSVSKAQTMPVDQKVDALISILVEAFPEVRKAAQDRAKKNADSREVTDALIGAK